MPSTTRALLSLVLACCCATACSNELDSTANLFPLNTSADTSVIDDTQATTSADADPDAPDACDCLQVGQWFRFDTLAVAALDDQKRHPIINVLNALWAADIAHLELNVWMEVAAVDGNQVTLRAVNAARLNADISQACLLPYTAIEMVFERQGCAMTMPTAASLNIYAGSESIPKNCGPTLGVKHTIPVSNVQITMNLAEECTKFTDGFVDNAALSETELGNICTCSTSPDQYAEACCANHDPANPDPNCPAVDPAYADPKGRCNGCGEKFNNLFDLLDQFGALSFKCTAPDGGRAACLDAKFTAMRIDQAPDVCAGQ